MRAIGWIPLSRVVLRRLLGGRWFVIAILVGLVLFRPFVVVAMFGRLVRPVVLALALLTLGPIAGARPSFAVFLCFVPLLLLALLAVLRYLVLLRGSVLGETMRIRRFAVSTRLGRGSLLSSAKA